MVKKKANRKRRRSREQVAAAWCKQGAWLVKTITNLHETPAGQGLKWTAKMVKHYNDQYITLRKNTPPRAGHQADVYDKEINSIMDHYTDLL